MSRSVYYPFIKIENEKKKEEDNEEKEEGKDNDDKLTKKIKKNDILLENEQSISDKIITIPFFYQYFIPILHHKNIFISSINEHSTHFKKMNNQSESYSIITEPSTENTFSFYEGINRHRNSPQKFISNLISTYKYLLSSIDILLSNQIIHMNINQESIIYDSDTQPKLRNFTKSYTFPLNNEERKSFLNLHNSYEFHLPLEIHVMSFLYNKKLRSLSHENIEQICTHFYGSGPLSSLFKDSINEVKGAAIFSLQKYINKSDNQIYIELFSQCSTWDNYSLSILYLQILTKYFSITSIDNNVFLSSFYKILVQNIHPESKKRLSIDNTLQQIDYLLENTERKEFLQLIHILHFKK